MKTVTGDYSAIVPGIPGRLTLAKCKLAIRAIGGSVNRTGYGTELRVRVAGGEYFADGYQDAIGTARAMAR